MLQDRDTVTVEDYHRPTEWRQYCTNWSSFSDPEDHFSSVSDLVKSNTTWNIDILDTTGHLLYPIYLYFTRYYRSYIFTQIEKL